MDYDADTVMNSGEKSDTLNGISFNTPPKFISGNTSKLQYLDALRRWIVMLNKVAQSDPKTKGLLNVAVHLIYKASDNDDQCTLQQAEVNGCLNLSGCETDPSGIILTNERIELIAKDTANQRIQN